MPTTPNRGYWYPDPTPRPDVPYDMQRHAQDVDADVAEVYDRLTRGVRVQVETQTAYVSTVTTICQTPPLDVSELAEVTVAMHVPAYQVADSVNAGHRYFTQVHNLTDATLFAATIGRIWATVGVGYSFASGDMSAVVDVSALIGPKVFGLVLDPAGKSMRLSGAVGDPIVLAVKPSRYL